MTKSLQWTDLPMKTSEAMHTPWACLSRWQMFISSPGCLTEASFPQHHLPQPVNLCLKQAGLGLSRTPSISHLYWLRFSWELSPCPLHLPNLPSPSHLHYRPTSGHIPQTCHLLNLKEGFCGTDSLSPYGELPHKPFYRAGYLSPLTRLKSSFQLKPWSGTAHGSCQGLTHPGVSTALPVAIVGQE